MTTIQLRLPPDTLTNLSKTREDLIKFADALAFVAGNTGAVYINVWSHGRGKDRRTAMFSGKYARSAAFQEVSDERSDERKGYSSGEDYLETMIVQPTGRVEFVHFLHR